VFNRIFELRSLRNLTLDQLAELSTVSKAELSRLERFDGDPKLSTVCKISKALGFPAYFVFPCDQPDQ
jgi:transcriptional regulator with XRE-family HTH domain